MKLNIFQELSLEQLDEGFRRGKNKFLLSMPPGTGKTLVSIKFVKNFSSVLYIAHHKELVYQSFKFFKKEYGENDCNFIDSNNFLIKRFNFITIQRLVKNLEKLDNECFSCIIIDEAHHSTAKTYLSILNKFKCLFLGITATPFRLDRGNVLELFENNCVFVGDIKEAINKGYLTNFSYYGFKDDIDYSDIRFQGIDYNRNDLDKKLFIDSRDLKIIEKYKQYLSEKKTIAFCNSIKHTKRSLKFFRKQNIKCESLTSKTPEKERQRIFSEFLLGDLKLIFTVNIFNEGLDFPDVDAVMLLRPSASYGLILQQIGRALRKYKNKKRAIILDFVGNHPYSYNIRNILSSNNLIGYNNFLKKQEYNYPINCDVFLERGIEEFMDEQLVLVLIKDLIWVCREYFELKKRIHRFPFEQDVIIFGKNNLLNFLNHVGIEKLWFYMDEQIRMKEIMKQRILSLALNNKLEPHHKKLITVYFKNKEFEKLLEGYKQSQILRLQKIKVIGVCPRCLRHEAKSCHHIIPRERGGIDNQENLIWLCEDCHNKVELNQDDWFKEHGLRDSKIIRNLIINQYF